MSTWLMFERFSYAAALESAAVAERVGFEPTIPLTVYKLSKPAPRTLRRATNAYLTAKLQ